MMFLIEVYIGKLIRFALAEFVTNSSYTMLTVIALRLCLLRFNS